MYSNEMTWDEWATAISQAANQMLEDLKNGKDLADKFNAMTYGLTAAQIAALPQFTGKTVTDATNMQYAVGVFTDLYNAMYNVAALPQALREGYLEPFI
jgi:hypothetical protein